MKKKRHFRQKLQFLLLYTALFALAAALAFWYFPEAGKRMVWKGDGLSQHYVALCYYARWGRAVLKGLLAGRPVFPTFNLHMGLGSDLFTTLQYYVIGDPFSLPAVLVPDRYMLVFHDAMILVRMYLAGVCFDGYCRAMGRQDCVGNLCGALVYVFCSFAMFGMRHPYFLNAMIWFPLLLTGAERMFSGKKGRLFTLAVFLSCISNFYFFYMLVALTLVYVVWRALRIHLFPALGEGGEKRGAGFSGEGKGDACGGRGRPCAAGGQAPCQGEKSPAAVWRAIFLLAARFLWRAVLGVAMGGCFLAPILLRFVRDPRASEGAARGIFYGLSYYAGLPEAFVGFGTDATLEYWTCLGFGVVGLASVLLLFLHADKDVDKETGRVGGRDAGKEAGRAGGRDAGKETGQAGGRDADKDAGRAGDKAAHGGRRTGLQANLQAGLHVDLQLAFVFMLVLTALPSAGAALNGFSYPANRWIWAFAMLVGFITATMVPAMARLSWKNTAAALGLVAVYAGICRRLGAARSTLAELALAGALVLLLKILAERKTGELSGTGVRLRHACRSLALVGAAMLTVAVHGYVAFVPGRMNSSLEEYHSDRYIAAMVASDAAGIRALLGQDAFYRYSARDLANNFSLLHDVSNTQYYWSLSDGNITQFFTETGQGNGMVHLYDNLDNRTMTDEIVGVRYYARSDGSLLPFGYRKLEGLHYDNRALFEEKEGDPLPVFSFSVYENAYALPLGFTSPCYISREAYDALSIPQRQEALMQGILLEDEGMDELRTALRAAEAGRAGAGGAEESAKAVPAESPQTEETPAGSDGAEESVSMGSPQAEEALDGAGIREARLAFTVEELSRSFRAEEGIEILQEDGQGVRLAVRDTGGALYLDLEDWQETAGREISLLFTGMDYAPLQAGDLAGDTSGAAGDAGGSAEAPGFAGDPDGGGQGLPGASGNAGGESASYENTEPVEITVTAKRDGKTVSKKKISYTLEDNPWKTGRTDFLSCCGYTEEALSGLRLQFSRPGIYTFRKLDLVCQPMEAYPAQARALRTYTLEDLDLHELEGSGATSRITGTIEVPGARLLCLQIPRCDGWAAFLDGEEVPLVRADTMFSALPVSAGRHVVELRYRTPGLAAGAALSLVGLAFFLLEIAAAAVPVRKLPLFARCRASARQAGEGPQSGADAG